MGTVTNDRDPSPASELSLDRREVVPCFLSMENVIMRFPLGDHGLEPTIAVN